ncbi:MAG: PAS domain S-box protein [Gammaproteobacteria bacterium]|nr:PAS domain S-box protein [Gammaproteobacteria bacterium]
MGISTENNTEDTFYQELLRSYIDSTDDAIFVLCDEMKFLLCNHAGEKFFGASEAILTKHNNRAPIQGLFSDSETAEAFQRNLPKVLDGEYLKFESHIKPKKADAKWIEFSLNRVALENIPMIVVVARDINKRKKFEIEMERHNETLEALVKERTKELLLANEQKDKIFSIIAHDLRGPFSPILGFAEILKEDAGTLSEQELKGYAHSIYISAKRQHELLDDLLDWSRLQLDRISISRDTIDLRQAAQDAIDILSELATQKNITLTNNILSTTVHADRNIVNTVLRNLINNAIKFTPENGSVTTAVNEKDDDYIVSVTDTGVGISKEKMKLILSENVTESSKGTSGEEGTGLGLPICINMINRHGGKLYASSEPGEGTTFYFTLKKLMD